MFSDPILRSFLCLFLSGWLPSGNIALATVLFCWAKMSRKITFVNLRLARSEKLIAAGSISHTHSLQTLIIGLKLVCLNAGLQIFAWQMFNIHFILSQQKSPRVIGKIKLLLLAKKNSSLCKEMNPREPTDIYFELLKKKFWSVKIHFPKKCQT